MSIPVGIVEDDAALRLQLVEWVNGSTRFHCVSVCGSAEDALGQFAQTRPVMALVDLALPRMSGLELIPRFRQILPELAILVLTHHDEDAWLFGALEVGAYGYLIKPAFRDDLLAAMDVLQAGGSVLNAGIARRVIQTFESRGDTRRELARLSAKDLEILQLVARGLSRKEVASTVQLSESSVFQHQRKICKALQVDGIAKAVAKYRAAHPVVPSTGPH